MGEVNSVIDDLLRFHDKPYTFSEWWNLPHGDGGRFGLVDGSLVISPAAGGVHQAAVGRLASRLQDAVNDQAPSGLEVLPRLVVRLGEHTALIPDIVLFTNPLPEQYLHPSAVLCAVEVIDEATARFDATIKPAVYASAGIPHFWLVDPTPPQPRIRCHRLHDGGYELHTELVAGTTTTVSEPVEITLDPAVMLSKTQHGSTAT